MHQDILEHDIVPSRLVPTRSDTEYVRENSSSANSAGVHNMKWIQRWTLPPLPRPSRFVGRLHSFYANRAVSFSYWCSNDVDILDIRKTPFVLHPPIVAALYSTPLHRVHT
jgi:hypothetical protein